MKDKVIHAGVCFVAVLLAFSFTYAFLGITAGAVAGVLFAMGLGIGKEVGDVFNPRSRWDWWDILADLVGCSAGVLVILIAKATNFI